MLKPALAAAAVLALAACAPSATRPDLQARGAPDDVAIANLNLAVEYMRRGEYERALEKLERARIADPGYPLTYNTYGVLYQMLGDATRAEQNFRKALALAPGDSATLNNYGRFLCQRQRIDDAQQAFADAANNPLYETPEIPIANAGICALSNGRIEEAERFFRRALDLDPNLPTALLQMAVLSHQQQKFLPARGYLQRYAAIAPHTAESLWLGVRIERELGDRNAVSSYALQLRNQFPDSDETRQLNASGTK